jgi:hypothetical protein
VLVIGLYGPQVVATTLARMGEPMPVAQVLDASVQGVPVGGYLADEMDGPRHAGLAQHPDGRFDS